jgi:hypothetical protein
MQNNTTDTLFSFRLYKHWLWVCEGNVALLGYYAASSGNYLPTFRDNLSVPSSGFKNTNENL